MQQRRAALWGNESTTKSYFSIFEPDLGCDGDDYVLYNYLTFGRFLFGLNGCISITYVFISFAPFRLELTRITLFLAGIDALMDIFII